MRELDVVRQTRSFLLQQGLAGRRVVDIYTDAHPTLISDASLRPFQRFTLALEGFTVHPDLVGRLDDGETTFAIEAKGEDDHLRGLAQASCYRFGFHLVFLVGAGRPPIDLVTLARQQHVGVLAAYRDRIDVLEIPPALQPLRQHARYPAAVRHDRGFADDVQFQPADALSRRRRGAPRNSSRGNGGA